MTVPSGFEPEGDHSSDAIATVTAIREGTHHRSSAKGLIVVVIGDYQGCWDALMAAAPDHSTVMRFPTLGEARRVMGQISLEPPGNPQPRRNDSEGHQGRPEDRLTLIANVEPPARGVPFDHRDPPLTLLERSVLVSLRNAQPQAVTFDALYREHWPNLDPVVDGTGAARNLIMRLRPKFVGTGVVIESIRGVGFAIRTVTAPVTVP